MPIRILLLVLAAAVLAACPASPPGPGPAPVSSTASPYDFTDRFIDAQGHPLPGWDYVRDPLGGPSM